MKTVFPALFIMLLSFSGFTYTQAAQCFGKCRPACLHGETVASIISCPSDELVYCCGADRDNPQKQIPEDIPENPYISPKLWEDLEKDIPDDIPENPYISADLM